MTGEKKGGFTIVEVMIFLIISALMFAIAAVMFSGTIGRNRFSQSMRDTESRFSDLLNDVSTGYFNEFKGSCSGSVSGPIFSSAATATQGTNEDCIFLGKAVLLSPNGSADRMLISSVVGLRLAAGRQVSTYPEAQPTTVYDNTLDIDLSEEYVFRDGTTIKSAKVGITSVPAAGFYNSLGSYVGTELAGGTTRTQYFAHTPSASTKLGLKNCLADIGPELSRCFRTVPPSNSWVICFQSGASEQTAQLSISGSGTILTKLEFIDCN